MYQQHTAEGTTGCGPAQARMHAHMHRGFRPHSSAAKAPVSIYKTDTTYEVMVFAPGRVKENFHVKVNGDELIIRYQPTDDTSSLDWIRKEYSRGGFERSFLLDDRIDREQIDAKYEDGVLKLSLHIIPGKESTAQEIPVN
jgi:HSP20 family protein